MKKKDEEIVVSAVMVRQRAHAPYSKFQVGAAIRAKGGRVYAGCDMENRSFGLTVCAERNAIATAIAHGEREFEAIAIATDADPPAPPCGACREVMAEFAPNLEIILVSHGKEQKRYKLKEIFPHQFVL